MRLLVIEDERKIARVISESLKREKYAVDISNDGEEGFNLADSQPYDLLIVDRMLPGMEGAEIVKNLRKNGKNMPILFLTALGTTEDKTFGLDVGADDYLVKPFAIDELLARVRALLRRPPIQQPDVLKIADLTIDKQQQTVMRAGKTIDLTSKEYALLEYLMQHPNQILSKETLINHVWDFDADILPNNVEAYIKNLRQKIDKPFKKQLIKTVRGFGYRIEA
jgi:hypothetical protein